MGLDLLLLALDEGIVLGDGAMGTEIQARGIPIGRPYPELNEARPDLIRSIHRDYRDAGARFHKTNTFTANRIRLAEFGLGSRVGAINEAGARLARGEAGKGAWVAGSVGPLSDRSESPGEKRAAYLEQCQALAEARVDVFLLETFTDPGDLRMALGAARAQGLPVIAQVALSGARAREVGGVEAEVRGANCVDPSEALKTLEEIPGPRRSIFPSAGRPGGAGALQTPAEFGRLALELVRRGARLVGGCCGTTPAHIQAASRELGLGGRP
jgi:homocysteine S-methyltransferase